MSLSRILPVLFLLLPATLFAQSRADRKAWYVVTGQVAEAQSGKAIGYATASLADADGRPITAAGTDTEGRFTLRTTQREDLHLCITYVGYVSYKQVVALSEMPLDMGRIQLQHTATRSRSSTSPWHVRCPTASRGRSLRMPPRRVSTPLEST